MTSHDPFVHLHVHTDYSALDGASRIGELVQRVVEIGQPGVAITDHGNTQGAYELWKTATEAGINPIIGQEFYVAPGGTSRHGRERVFFGHTQGEDKLERSNDVSGGGSYTHMTIWAENTRGMHNLFKMSSYAFLEGRFGTNQAPRIDDDLLAEHSKGIIATTGCPSGEVQTRLRLGQYDEAIAYAAKMQDILGKENYYCELMDHGLSIERRVRESLLKLARDLNIPLVATNDTHYTRRDEAVVQDHMLCIQTGSNIDDEKRFRFDGDGYYIKTAAEMRELFKDLPEACDNTLEIAERCKVNFAEGIDLMPKFDVPEGETEASFLEKEVIRLLPERVPGWEDMDEEKQKEYEERGRYECSIIDQMGFPSYFLVVGDFVQWAKDNGIAVGPGRGCLAGDSPIETTTGTKLIKDIVAGDKVYDENGRAVEVPMTFDYDVDETLLEIAPTAGHPIKMTHDHKVLARKQGETQELWYRARELETGDSLVKPLEMDEHFSGEPGFSYIPIASITEVENPSGKVYDLNVPTTNSYVTKDFVVHNSAGGCLVAYAMSITELDPIRHNLLFERFLNPERVSMPDIDIDFDDQRRGEVIAYVTEKYGEEKVAQIVTFGLIKAKAALKDATRILGHPFAVGALLSQKMPEMIMGKTMTLKGVFDETDPRYDEAEEFRSLITDGAGGYDASIFREVVDVALGLEGHLRGTGIHAAGVLMSSKPIIDSIPIMLPKEQSKSKKKQAEKEGIEEEKSVITTLTQFDYPTCETLGLLKMDFLGLRNLTIIADAFRNINSTHGTDYSMNALIHSELDDPETYELLRRGDTLGVFQLDGCLAGNTLVSGRKISELYKRWINGDKQRTTRSLNLSNGRKEENQILKIVESGVKPVYRLVSESGRLVEATADHKFMTSNGWKKLGDIDIEKDKVLVDSTVKTRLYRECADCGKQLGSEQDNHAERCYRCSETFHSNPSKPESRQEMSASALRTYENGRVVWTKGQTAENNAIMAATWECSAIPQDTSFEDVVSIEYVNEQMTYDISMKAPLNNFLANGFMVHNSGIRSLLKLMRPTNFNDISAVLALYRPGPMGMNAHVDYADRKNGRKPVTPIHPELAEPLQEILADTFFLVTYQEQIMQIAQKVAGYSLGQADLLRRAMGKKKKSEMDKQYQVFLGGMKNNGYSFQAFSALWNVLLPFADYAFNRCVAGDTEVMLEPSDSDRTDTITVEELYSTWEDVHKGTGLKAMALDKDGTLQPKPIKGVHYNGEKEAFRVALADGRHITATFDHRHMTPDGWKQVVDLRVGDSLLAAAEGDEVSAVQIVSIESVGVIPTYDLEMDDAMHCWVGNGVVTHNSHSAGYALLSYVTAWLKAHYPTEYMAALLSSVSTKPEMTALYLNECRHMGITVSPPDIRTSLRDYTPQENKRIVFGLGSIRGLGTDTVEEIIVSRDEEGADYSSLDAVLSNFPTSSLNKKVFDGLIQSGALDFTGHNRKSLSEDLIATLGAVKKVKEDKDEGAMSLFDTYDVDLPPIRIGKHADYSKREKLSLERRMLGLYVSDHPLSNMEGVLDSEAERTVADIMANPPAPMEGFGGEKTQIAGVITGVENKKTRKGDNMQIATMEDMTGEISVLLFSKTISMYGFLQQDAIYKLKGTLRSREDEAPSMIVDSFSEIEIDEETGQIPMWMKLTESQLTDQAKNDLLALIRRHRGDSPLRLSVKDKFGSTRVIEMGAGYRVNKSRSFAQALMEMFGARCFGKW